MKSVPGNESFPPGDISLFRTLFSPKFSLQVNTYCSSEQDGNTNRNSINTFQHLIKNLPLFKEDYPIHSFPQNFTTLRQ